MFMPQRLSSLYKSVTSAFNSGTKRRRIQSFASTIEVLTSRELLSGIGGVKATITETQRDFAFKVAGRATGTTTALGYKDSYTATLLSNTSGTVSFTSPTKGSGRVSGSARIVGRDTFESYSYTRSISGSGSVDNGTLTKIKSPSLPAGLTVTGTFNPLTWAVGTRWNGTVDGARVVGSFTGSVSQALPKTDFAATVTFDTTAADAIHTDKTMVKDVAAKVKAVVTITATGQHMKAASMASIVTTARIYLGDPNKGGRELVTPIPIHWNTGKIVVNLENFLNKKNASGKLYIVLDQEKKVVEANETNNKLAFDIPYDIEAEGLGWQPTGSVLGSYRIAVAGFNNTALGSTSARIYFANANGRVIDANPATSDVLDALFSASPGWLSSPTFTNGSFGAFSLPLTWRPNGATQIVLTVDNHIIPPNKEINELNNTVALKLTELSSKGLAVNSNGTSRLTLNVSNAPLSFSTTAVLYWASGTAGNYSLLKKATQVSLLKGGIGNRVYDFSASRLGVRPANATSLIVVIDPAATGKSLGIILEPDEKNTFALNTAPSNIQLSKSTIDENAGRNTLIGQLSARHPDAADGLVYRLAAGTGSTNNASFRVSSTGRLTSNAVFNFEVKSSYSIRVRASDRLGFSTEKVFIIRINDLPGTVEVPASVLLAQSFVVNRPAKTDAALVVGSNSDVNSSLPLSLISAGSTEQTEEQFNAADPEDMTYRDWVQTISAFPKTSALGNDISPVNSFEEILPESLDGVLAFLNLSNED